MHRPEPRTTAGIDHGHNDLEAAGRIKHNPVKRDTVAIDADEVAYCVGVHNPSVSRLRRAAEDHPSTIDSVAVPIRGFSGQYCGLIDNARHRPNATARDLARAVDRGRHVSAALRHLDFHGSEPGTQQVAEALARFLVARCDSHHAGWRVVRQVIVDSAADAPWEKCARRAVPMVADDLMALAAADGRTQLPRAQHIAAQRRAEQIASHVDQDAVLAGLGLRCAAATPDRWRLALSSAVRARSREQVARAVDRSFQTD